MKPDYTHLGTAREAFARAVVEERARLRMADVGEGMPSVDDCMKAHDCRRAVYENVAAVRGLMLAAFERQLEGLKRAFEGERECSGQRMQRINELENKLAAAEKRLALLEWRPVSVKPTREDADDSGNVEMLRITESGKARRWLNQWGHIGLESGNFWRPFYSPAPSAEEVERNRFEDTFPNMRKERTPSGRYVNDKFQGMWESWRAARSAKEGEK